jgi:hypothetical protein
MANRLLASLRNLLRRKHVDRDLNAEIDSHLQLLSDEYCFAWKEDGRCRRGGWNHWRRCARTIDGAIGLRNQYHGHGDFLRGWYFRADFYPAGVFCTVDAGHEGGSERGFAMRVKKLLL